MKNLLIRLGGSMLALMVISANAYAGPVSEQDLKAKIEMASKGFEDISATVVVREKNKEALTKVHEGSAVLYDFQSAQLQIKTPDRIRIESKLGMVKVEYIVADGKKIFRAPKIKMNKTSDYSNMPAKLQRLLDFGIVTPQLWVGRHVEIVEDAEANSNGEIKLKLTWLTGDAINYAWIDAANFWLKRFEKRDGQDNLISSVVYSNPQNVGNVIWLPTKVELYTADGQKAGATEMVDIKVNTGLADSIFK